MQQSFDSETDPRWAALLARDASADGLFFYSVKTTGIYCRPSCTARLAKPQHVRFHVSVAAAEAAGFRPCKRCKPHQPYRNTPYVAAILTACRLMERGDQPLNLAVLAQQAGISRFHFHRLFKAATGLTPHAYAAAQRRKRLLTRLDNSPTITEAIYEAGYQASSRFYEKARQLLGMTPRAYRAKGAATTIRFAVAQCTLGAVLVAQSQYGICAIMLGDDPAVLVHELQDRFCNAELLGADVDFENLVARVIGLIEEPRQGLDLPLDVRGTAFQQRVWQALQDIPLGSTASYSDIAAHIGAPQAARAVASACAANPLAVVIPCHRVVRSDGSLSGYRWGIERKRTLLERERST